MEAHIKLAKTTFMSATPLACLLARTADGLPAAEKRLLAFFDSNHFLKEKYGSVKALWGRLLAIRQSRCGAFIVALVDDNCILLFDALHSCIYAVAMPMLENILLCTVSAAGRTVTIGGVYQVLALHTDSGRIAGADFSDPDRIRPICCTVDPESQKKVSVRPLDKAPRTDYTGDYHEVVSSRGIEVRGLVGTLFTREQYLAFQKLLKQTGEKEKEEEDEGEPMPENDTAKYVLCLSAVTYSEDDNVTVVKQRTASVEYQASIAVPGAREACLIVRSDSACNMNVVVLNSSHKYYCQIILLPTASLAGQHLRPINFISSEDVLPTDKYGRTSMMVSDVAWTPNDAFFVVTFCANYFCVISRLGQPLKLFSPAYAVQHFFVLEPEFPNVKLDDDAFPHITVTDTSIFLSGDSGTIAVRYEPTLQLMDLWKVEQAGGKVNRLLRLVMSLPELGVKAGMLESLEQVLDSEVIYFSPQKRSCIRAIEKRVAHESLRSIQPESSTDVIQFKNPFPQEPTVEVPQIVGASLLLIEATRWSDDIGNNLFELIQDELENTSRLLYLKNEPLYFLDLMQLFKKFAQRPLARKPTMRCSLADRKLVAKSHQSTLALEKKKALLMLYCLIQFRNFKATSFNILYLVAAGLIRNRWGKHRVFSDTLTAIISTLKCNLASSGSFPHNNLPVEKTKKQDFFETEMKTTLVDKGALYAGMFALCEKTFAGDPAASPAGSEEAQIGPLTTERKAEAKKMEEKSRPATLPEILLSFYETARTEQIVATINDCVKDGNREKSAILALDATGINNIYTCVSLLRKGKFAAALEAVKKTVSAVVAPEALLKPDSKVERSLAFMISAACLMEIALTLLKRRTIDEFEIPTFFYKVLSAESLPQVSHVSDQLAACLPLAEESHSPTRRGKMKEVFTAVSILLQLSARQLAVRELFASARQPANVLLGLMLVSNQINQVVVSSGKLEEGKEYVGLLKRMVAGFSEQYIYHVAEFLLRRAQTKIIIDELETFTSLLSVGIGLTSRIIALMAAWIALPNFAGHLRGLLHTAALSPEQLVQTATTCRPCEVAVCPFVDKLAKHFCACSHEACQRVFGLYFLDSARASLFNVVLQESAQILSACAKQKLIELSPPGGAKGEFVRVFSSKLGSPKVADDIRSSVCRLLDLVWELVLLLSIEGCKRSESVLGKLRLSGCLLRYSALGASEQQELEYIQQAMALLCGVNFAEVRPAQPAENEALHDLANAFDVYTEKWEGIVKGAKTEILNAARTVRDAE